ncbi:MAG: VWA domain-containing protein [Myxococcaceae bacterium]|nr:VWA domain-containing protein [Myxococcaceae bacterium]MCA3015800.1 VWA domain-containing protein [Myxococcaceae bacterium]
MNRTTTFIALAVALLLLAVVGGLPKPPPPTPTTTAPPMRPPVVAPAPPPATQRAPGALRLTGKLSHPVLAPGTSDVFATLEVSAVDRPGAPRAAVNLAVVIDRSGSMSGAKIAQARRAALHLVELLNETDRLAIVHYGTDVQVLPGAFATAANKERMRGFVRAISEQGGTNIGDALVAGKAQLDVARSDFTVNRLILLSDGQPTVGVTSAAGLERVAQTLRSAGTTITALGVGADFNEDLMQRLAELGGGSYGFIRDAEATASLFERDLAQAGTMVARGVTVSVELPPGVALREVLGRPSAVEGRRVTVTMPDFSARQTERLVVHLTASGLTGAEGAAVDVAAFRLDYVDLLASQPGLEQLRLAALVTGDRALAEQRRDPEALVFANRARASQNVERAADAMKQGLFEQARRFIADNKRLIDEAESVAGTEALAGDRALNAAQLDSTAPAPQMEQAERAKSLKVEARRGFGLGASVY